MSKKLSRKSSASKFLVLCAAFYLWGSATGGRAAVLGTIEVKDNSSTVDFGEQRREARSTSIVEPGGTATTFGTAHHHLVAADAALGFRKDSRPTFTYKVTVPIFAAPDELWQLNLDSDLIGKVFVRDDTAGGGNAVANAYIKGFGFNWTAKNALLSKGSLLISEEFETGSKNDDQEVIVNVERTAYYSGHGSQTLVIDLSWESYADSNSNEAAARFGINPKIDGFLDGENVAEKIKYPNSATPTDDGYFIDGTLKSPGRIYAMTLPSVASRIDITDGFELPINLSPGVNFVTGLTLSESNDVFGISRVPRLGGGFDNQLFSTNPNTGTTKSSFTLQLNEPTGVTDVQGLELIGKNPDQLFVLNSYATNAQSLHRVDRQGLSQARMELTYAGPFIGQKPQIIDLAYDKTGQILYGWDLNTGLVTIDQNTGLIFDTISFSGGSIEAIAYDDMLGNLYGLGRAGLYSINTMTEQDVLISDPNIYGDYGDFVILDNTFYSANLIYHPSTGNVQIDPRFKTLTAIKIIASGGLPLDSTALDLPPAASLFAGADFLSIIGLDTTLPFSIGAILPTGLTADQLRQYSFQFALADGILKDGASTLAQIPEPVSAVLTMLCVGITGLPGARRGKK